MPDFATPWTAAHQASLSSFTISWSLLKFMSLSQWCYLTTSPSATHFLFYLQSFQVSGSFPMSRFFASGAEIFGASALASVLPVNIHGWFLLGLTGLISLQSKGLSRVFSSTMIWKHQFCAQPSLCRVINTCPHGTYIPVGDRKTTPKKKKKDYCKRENTLTRSLSILIDRKRPFFCWGS